jgi:23S rRNA (guanosine2251-2'-O)-methyltransferase
MPAVLVVGAEGAGLGTNLRKHCDLLLSLPMRGRVESLNAATAGAIAIYELLRREAREVYGNTGFGGPETHAANE